MSKSTKFKKKFRSFAAWVLLGIAVWGTVRYFQKGCWIDLAPQCGMFEARINDILARHGVRESNLTLDYHSERKELFPIPTSWIETDREIILPSTAKADKLLRELEACANDSKLEIIAKSVSPEGTLLAIGKSRRIYQKLTFIRTGSKGTYRAALVIDDVAGRPTDFTALDSFFALRIPITYAVLPMERETRKTSEKIHKAGFEIIVHQPMEPEDLPHNDPGKAAFLIRMTAPEIGEKLQKNFKSVPYAEGLSNHMGSRFTSSRVSMEILFGELKKLKKSEPRLQFFLDSRTHLQSLGLSVGKKAAFPALQNEIFLDNVDSEAEISKQLEEFKTLVKQKGSAIAIGHVQRKHLTSAIKKYLPSFRKERIQFVPLSGLLPKNRKIK